MNKEKYNVNIEEKYTAFQTTIGNIDIADKDAQLKIKSLAEEVSEDIDDITSRLSEVDDKIVNATVGLITEEVIDNKITLATSGLVTEETLTEEISNAVSGMITEEIVDAKVAEKIQEHIDDVNNDAYSKSESDERYQPKGSYTTSSDVEQAISNVIPNAPSTNGTYTLTCTVQDGVVTYKWVAAGE